MKLLSISVLVIAVLFGVACSSNDNKEANTPVSATDTTVAATATSTASATPNNTATGSSGSTGANAATIDVVEQDYTITLDTNSVDNGKITFHITNQSDATTHEFVVFKTDLAEDKLPVDEGEVNEDADSLDHIDEVEDIEAGKTKDLTVDLEPGHYVLICNITGHYQMGMHATLQVE